MASSSIRLIRAVMKYRPSRVIEKSHVPITLLLGNVVKLSVVGLDKQTCAKVRVRRNDFNSYLNQFFVTSDDFWAWDKFSTAKLGDIVLIRSMQKPLTRKVMHNIDKIVFVHGNIVDPITGKRVVQEEFLEDAQIRKTLIEEVLKEDEQLKFGEKLQSRRNRLNRMRLNEIEQK